MQADSSARLNLRALLFPSAPRHFPWARPVQLLLRSLHIAADGTHMPGAWRHFSFPTGQVARYPD